MLEDGQSVLVDPVRDKAKGSHECHQEDGISDKVDDMGPPSGGAFDVNVELL